MSKGRWRIVAATVAFLAAPTLAFVFNLPLRFLPSADQRAVESAFLGALAAELQVQTTTVEPPNQPFREADLGSQHRADSARLAGFTIDPLLARSLFRADSARRVQLSDAPHKDWVDAGIDSVNFNEVLVNGNHATVRATAEVWFNFDGRGGPPATSGSGAAGHNGVSYRADVVRLASGRWLVRDYTAEYLAGAGP
jgi:hypothetical protein